ncbi:MAG: ABC transporter substrate-binding protein [Elusimicrobia bacterium]|nr:ABC transporter substrate-binding protein [Elusimicrobiota bacterium]
MRSMILSLFAALLSGPAAAAEPMKIVYALPMANSAVLPFVAVDKGFFKDEGLDVEARMFSSGREGLQALFAGQAQLQTVSETPLVHAAIQGNRFVTIATVARSRETKLLARKDSGIKTPADLAGKRVATLPGTNSDYYMYKLLAAHGLKPEQLKIANMPPPEMIVAFSKGDIDALFAWEPHIHFALKKMPEARVIEGGDLYHGYTTVNMDPEFLKKNPEVAPKAVRALLKAEAYLKTHEEESRKIVAARLKMDPGVVDSLWKEYVYGVELDKGLVAEMTEIGTWALSLNKSDKALPNFREFLHESALRAERPKSVAF